jgi:transcriptional regulator with XRE-family HTH domain
MIAEEERDELLKKQGQSLKRLIKMSGIPVIEIAKKIGVDRQTIYVWMRGEAAIPEGKIIDLGKLFNKQPAEIRYDITLYNQRDMAFIVRLLENELERRHIRIDADKKAAIISTLYAIYQAQKKTLHKSFMLSDFSETALGFIDSSLS